MEDYYNIDHQQYCNYPEVSKKTRPASISDDQSSSSLKSSFNGIPSLTTEESSYSSQSRIFGQKEELSLVNFLQGSTSLSEAISYVGKETVAEYSENVNNEESEPGEGSTLQKEYYPRFIDPNGWIKCSTDNDPWNEENYIDDCHSLFVNEAVLSSEMVSESTCKLVQLPDSKHFVFSRLHLNNKGLEDISVLCEYRFFQYIDLSWNYISDLNALNNCKYLMYLNVAHNKLSSVLDFSPPWFLTHVNLSCNEVKEIGENISNFWSLQHLDLSYNNIEKLQGFRDLKYLKYLNLSHNHIKSIEYMGCINIEELYLQYNDISDVDAESSGFNNFKNIKKIDMCRNKMYQLQIFKELYTIEELDVSENCISNLAELDIFVGFRKLIKLNLNGNSICSTIGYRELAIYRVPNLKLLDSVIVNSSEKVAATMLFDPDIFTRTHHTRAKMELWNQLARQDINVDTVPCDQFPIPLVILVGTFDNGKEVLARRLELEFPDQIYRFRKHTTMSEVVGNDAENLISISTSVDEFNAMIKSGRFLSYYKETGLFFGICREELCKCVVESKIGLIDTNLETALVLKSLALRPILVLCVAEDTSGYAEKLRNDFMKMGLKFNTVSMAEQCNFDVHNVSWEKENENTEDYVPEFRNDTNAVPSQCNSGEYCYISGKKSKTVRWDLNALSEIHTDSHREPSIVIADDDSCEDDFKWTWSLESNETTESIQDENYLLMLKQQQKFVTSTIEEQSLFIELNNAHPSLFKATVCTDNIEISVKTIMEVCYNILESRELQMNFKDLTDNDVFTSFVEKRAACLLKNLLDISASN